ncbi:T9SS type A sorting domain-containing protein [candidate division KSB1 bacterium]|nr:T9SS type A sorting domain-containing protein [candidate division KSB1 bacterium]
MSFKLEQNYPNPFNPSTEISYNLPEQSFVTLKVYDVLGREIFTLVNEDKPAGTYRINFDTIGLGSGVYFYQLKAENFMEKKKMILIK